MTKKVTININGKKRSFTSMTEAAQAAGMNYTTFYQRLRRKLKANDAFKAPVRPYNRRQQQQP